MKKVGFCFLSHSAHIRHLLPIAIEYSNFFSTPVDLLVTSKKAKKEIDDILRVSGIHNCQFKELSGSLYKQVSGKIKGRLYPNIRDVIKKNKRTLLTYDCLVTPHHNLNSLMDVDTKGKVKYVCSFHGAGDGEVGFDERFKPYDLLLAPGEEIAERLKKEGIHHNGNKMAICGYPKLDSLRASTPIQFSNQAPVVLYNPHYTKHLSSWYKHGMQVLEWFKKNPEYNLIFAPHIKLFGEKFPLELGPYNNLQNIHIDINSENLTNSTYTKQADIYLGDVSSQVYETLYFATKPLIFLNSHKLKWLNDDNFKMWTLGQVISSEDELGGALGSSFDIYQKQYKCLQEEMIARKFSVTEDTAGFRAANEIYKFIE